MKRKLLSFTNFLIVIFILLSGGSLFGQVIINPVTDSIAQVNVLYTYQLTFVKVGTAPTFALQTKPAGMTINATTGLISWTPASLSSGGPVVVIAHNSTGDWPFHFNVYVTNAVECDPSIISYWPMDEKTGTSVPEVTHGYNGLWNTYNGPEPVVSTDGKIGNSIKFAPTNNEDWAYNVTDQNQYEFKAQTQFSVSFWFKNQPSVIPLPQHPQAFIGRFCGEGAPYNNAGWYIRWNPANERVEFIMRDHGPTDTTLVNPVQIAGDDFEWHHVVATFYSQTDPETYSFMHLFVDGTSSLMQYDFWTDDFDGIGDLTLGYYYWATEPFSGLLDEVNVWNKELLQADVNQLKSKGIAHQPVCAEGNTAPIFTSAPITAATQDLAYSYKMTYSEIDGDPITKTAPVLPSWLHFNASTGMLTGTPTNSNVGDNNVTLRVSDGNIDVDQTFIVTVANVNDIPVITSTASTSVDEDVAYSYTLVANDVDPGAVLTYSAPVLPTWMAFNTSTHVLSGTPTNAEVGLNAYVDFSVTLRVTDNASATVDQSFVVRVNQVNDAPVVNGQDVLDVNEDNDLLISLDNLNVTDVDNLYPNDFTLTIKDGSNYTNSGNTITPSANWNGTLTVPAELTDGTATVLYNLSVNVTAVNDAPAFISDPVLAAVAAQLYQYWIYTSDVEGSPRTLTCTQKPAWLSFSSDAGNGILQGTPSRDDVGNASVTLRVTDGNIYTDQTFTIDVVMDNYVPVVTSTPDNSVIIGELYTYTMAATDQDDDALTYSATLIPDWLTFNEETHVLSGIPAESDAGDNNVTLRVSDSKDNVDQSFTITVLLESGVNDKTSLVSLVYPVPAKDFVTFDFAAKLDKASLEIYSTDGALLKKLDVSYQSSFKLNVSDLQPNHYIYRISTAKGRETGPLVIE
jgi:hypothetical protein